MIGSIIDDWLGNTNLSNDTVVMQQCDELGNCQNFTAKELGLTTDENKLVDWLKGSPPYLSNPSHFNPSVPSQDLLNSNLTGNQIVGQVANQTWTQGVNQTITDIATGSQNPAYATSDVYQPNLIQSTVSNMQNNPIEVGLGLALFVGLGIAGIWLIKKI